jgi:AcrR family transcriptional regulator
VLGAKGKEEEPRCDRRKRRNRQALIRAGYEVMAKKGIDAATMSKIAELADVGAGTVYITLRLSVCPGRY